ncbi:MAG: UMP kinase [Methermicoccaceae archaeon]
MLAVISIGGSVLSTPEDFVRYSTVLRRVSEEHTLYVVVGGGKVARMYINTARELTATEALCDQLGITITRLNASLLISALGKDAYPIVPESYEEAHLASLSGRIVVMGGVAPGYTTDAVSAILADYVGADILISMTATKGVYTKDPEIFEDAQHIDSLSYDELLELSQKTLMVAGAKGPFDPVGILVAKRANLKLVITSGKEPENLVKALSGTYEGGTVVK